MVQIFVLKKVLLLMFLCFAATPFLAEGQSSQKTQKQFEKALTLYKTQDFDGAIEDLNKIIQKESNFEDAYLLLSEIYQETDNREMEIESLLKAQNISTQSLISFRLAEAYFSLADYENALKQYENYVSSPKTSEKLKNEATRNIENCKFAINAIKHPVEFNPEKLSDNINSDFDEYWPVISLEQNKLVFTRLIREPGRIPQEDFYVSEMDSGAWSKAQPISEINSMQNEGAETLSSNERLLFFTACNRPDGRGSCDIYYSRFIDGKWTRATNAGNKLNTGSWEAQPSFSSDNRYLYFSSNRAGGKGAKDIWRIEFKGFDESESPLWGKVKNLGDSINTAGDEISPFIHPNNRNFYFVSDYHTGMGGFDLFSSEITADSIFSQPVNLGYPINTQKNEQGLNISADGQNAYFASERDKNKGLDIYRFELDKSIRPTPVTYVKTKVIDAKTEQELQASINLVDLSGDKNPRTEETDDAGELLLCLPLGTNYAFNVLKDGYLFYSQSFPLFDIKTLHEPYIFTIKLQPIEIGAEMNLYNIYFETDSFKLLPESKPELNRLVNFLKNNPTLTVEIQGHTDNTGNEKRNQELSEFRAKSVLEYLTENGIDFSRLSSQGFGQQQPVASNETEEGRKLNRRTTIKISGK